MREDRDGGHGGELGWQLGDGAAGQSQWRVSQGPLMEMDGMQGTEAVDTVKVISWQLEASGALQEGVVSQLEGGVQGDWCW